MITGIVIFFKGSRLSRAINFQLPINWLIFNWFNFISLSFNLITLKVELKECSVPLEKVKNFDIGFDVWSAITKQTHDPPNDLLMKKINWITDEEMSTGLVNPEGKVSVLLLFSFYHYQLTVFPSFTSKWPFYLQKWWNPSNVVAWRVPLEVMNSGMYLPYSTVRDYHRNSRSSWLISFFSLFVSVVMTNNIWITKFLRWQFYLKGP